jgi:hypothetical protein
MARSKNAIYSEEAIEAALAATRGMARHRIPAAARIIGCSESTLRKYRERKEVMRSRKRHRKHQWVHPTDAEMELALHRTAGNAMAAARIIGCSENYVVRYIGAERAKGREIGRRVAGRRKFDGKPAEIFSNAIEAEVDFGTPPIPLTEEQIVLHAKSVDFFADILGAESVA